MNRSATNRSAGRAAGSSASAFSSDASSARASSSGASSVTASSSGASSSDASAASSFDEWMLIALAEARHAVGSGDVPVGAVLVDAQGAPIALGHNERERTGDPTAHAEVVAIRAAASARGSWRLDETTLIVTLEPCAMCAGAILQSRIPRVVFGAWDDKAGAAGSVNDLLRDRRLPHRVDVIAGVRETECALLLAEFFQSRRSSD